MKAIGLALLAFGLSVLLRPPSQLFHEPRCQENPYREIRIFIEQSEPYDSGGTQGFMRLRDCLKTPRPPAGEGQE
jgi:hypothetical protein